ncbi:hypothetical protein JCM5353_001579 [Sporobolomyces roseus]
MNRLLAPTKSLLAPLRRTRDPLLSSSLAQHFILPSGNSFIIRPPPSTLPPTIPIPSQSTSESNPFLDSITSSSSSGLNPLTPQSNLDKLPSTRRSSSTTPSTSTQLTREQIDQLQELRRTNPTSSRAQLAKQFGVSTQVVGRLGYGKGSEARLAQNFKRVEVEQERQEREESWGWKKSIAREERRRRRDLW